MATPFENKQYHLGLLYGLIAGVAFSFIAWGLDGIKLAGAHVAYPYAKFLVALLICGAVGALIGWLTIRLNKWYVTIILWLMFGGLGVWLAIWLPIEFSAAFLRRQVPMLSSLINYPMVMGVQQFRIVGMVAVGGLSLLCGVLESVMVENPLTMAHGGMLVICLICLLIMGMAGLATDELLNRQFREPVQALDDLFSFAIANQGKEVDFTLASRKHLSAVEDISELLSIDGRRIILIAYDSVLGQQDFLVDFHGTWVRCTTIYSQPTLCVPVKELTHKYFVLPVRLGHNLFGAQTISW
jgi:hypothetical protein